MITNRCSMNCRLPTALPSKSIADAGFEVAGEARCRGITRSQWHFFHQSRRVRQAPVSKNWTLSWFKAPHNSGPSAGNLRTRPLARRDPRLQKPHVPATQAAVRRGRVTFFTQAAADAVQVAQHDGRQEHL